MSEEFDFEGSDFAPKQQVVRYRGKVFILHEASEDAAVKYKNRSIASAKFKIQEDGIKNAVMEGMANIEPFLVSQCLYAADVDETLRLDAFGNPDRRYLIPEATILSMPSKVVRPMYDWIRKVSDLIELPDTKEAIEKQVKLLMKKLDKIEADERKAAGEEGEEESQDPNPTPGTQEPST